MIIYRGIGASILFVSDIGIESKLTDQSLTKGMPLVITGRGDELLEVRKGGYKSLASDARTQGQKPQLKLQ